MASIEDLHNRCNTLRAQRKEEVISVLDKWLTKRFIEHSRPWHAVVGNKRCRPIPIHRDFYNDFNPSREEEDNYVFSNKYYWPNISQDELKSILKELGFVVYTEFSRLCIAVPPRKRGNAYTYAQEWVKKINYNYSTFIVKERSESLTTYNQVLCELFEYDDHKVQIGKDSIIFYGYKHPYVDTYTPKRKYLLNSLASVGIYEYRQNGHYEGLYLDCKRLKI